MVVQQVAQGRWQVTGQGRRGTPQGSSSRPWRPWRKGLQQLYEGRASRAAPDSVGLCITNSACEKAGQWRKAMFALRDAGDSQVSPDEFSWSPVLRGCSSWPQACALLMALPQERLNFGGVCASSAISTQFFPWHLAQSLLRRLLGGASQQLNLVAFNALATAAAADRRAALGGARSELLRPVDWSAALGHLERWRGRSLGSDEVSVLAIYKAGPLWDLGLRLLLYDFVQYFQSKTLTAYLGSSPPWPLAVHLQTRLSFAGLQVDLPLQRGVLICSSSGGRWRRVLRATAMDPADALRASNGLSACAVARQWRWSLHVLQQLERRTSSDAVCVHGAAKGCTSNWALSLQVLHRSWERRIRRDVVGYGTLISAVESWPMALRCLEEMSLHEVSASRVARNAALAAAAPAPGASVAEANAEATEATEATWRRAVQLFGAEQQPGEITFRALLGSLEESGQDARALDLLWAADAAGVVTSGSFYLWALGRLGVADPRCLQDALRFAVQRLQTVTSPQELATLLWSASSLGISCPRLTAWVTAESKRQLSAFTLTDLLFLALGCGDLLSTALYARDASCHALQLGDALVQEQLRRFQRWQDIPTAALPTSSGAIAQMAEEMLGVVWALNFARLGASLGSPARAAMRRLSQILDGPKVKRLAQQTMVPAEPLSSDAFQESITLRLVDDKPVFQMLEDRLLILKPCGWETTGHADAPQLPDFLQASGLDRPVLRDRPHQCGFVHRLDVPSSGLLLCGLTYEAYYDLKLQLTLGQLQREYLVLCHGLAPARDAIRARVTWKADRGPSRVGRGKPSVTYVQRLAAGVLHRAQACALLGLTLGSGRRHQIRAQLAHVGHPVLCDGKYCAEETFRLDSPLCPQHCLHRAGLGVGARLSRPKQVFRAPLPPVFARLLQAIEGKTREDQEVLQRSSEDT
ncbi:unnamed protein product [Durusdinium trenchii]|uniref:Pseudouridine synthase RsuA/RluA-like domain-containing protein n=2 Tax=Durusdinium trenchii TaxID=1381693 RepID=A0ABP0PRK8_9DINO